MSKTTEPTVAMKIEVLTAACNGTKDEATIRALIADRKIRSHSRLNEVAQELQAEQIALEQVAPVEVEPEVVPMEASATIVEEKPKYQPGLIRGYSFGKVWMNHVANVDKLVLRPTKLGKLQATAKFVGLDIDVTAVTQRELATIISEKLAAQQKVSQ